MVKVDKHINYIINHKNKTMCNQIDVNGVKITLTQEQLKQIADQTNNSKEKEMHDFMYNLCKEMVMKISNENEISYYNLNDGMLFRQNYKTNHLWFNYNKIYKSLKTNFKLNEQQIKDFVGNWVEKNFNWKGFIPDCAVNTSIDWLENNHN